MNIFNMISNCREMALHHDNVHMYILPFSHSVVCLLEGSTDPSKANSPECNLVLPISVSSSLSFPEVHQAAAYISSSCHSFPSLYFSFNNVFLKTVPTQDVTNPVSHPSTHSIYSIPLLLDYALLLCFSHDQSN